MNPSDILSRGASITELQKMSWWKGPDWLYESSEHWPNAQVSVELNDEVLAERKKVVVSAVCLEHSDERNNMLQRFDRISSYLKTIRVCAWMLRFCANCKRGEKQFSGPLELEEIERAEKTLLKIVQEELPESVITYLRASKDEDGLLRVAARNESFYRALILLPSKHFLVEKLVTFEHEKESHAGAGVTFTKLRERFWIDRGRNLVKKLVRSCRRCKRFVSKHGMEVAAPLPDERVDIRVSAFQHSAVDLFGPLILRDGSKCWGIIFSCAVYRAVHLDVCSSLSTDCFVMALRRFIARRGKVSYISSDNGTNFVGFQNQLNNIDWDKVKDFTTTKRIVFRTHPPLSPWYNSICERMIKLVKEILVRNVGRASLTSEELYTVLCDCERVINARPLTYVSSEAADFDPITPAMFLNESSDGTTDVVDIIESDRLIKRVQYVRRYENS